MSLVQEIKALFDSETGRGVLGQRVENLAVSFGAAAGGRTALFDIAGGEVYIRCLYCVCTVAPAGGAQAVQFDCTPTAGAVGVMDDGVGDINGILIGAIIAPQGDVTNLPAVVAGPLTGGPTFSMPWLCQTGEIGITCAAALDHGDWDCIVFYVPLTNGATVVAA